jgi:acetolactate synthase-1/2/3 large subunit
MKGAEALLEALRDRGVDTVFGYPGGAIMPLYDALLGSGIRHVLVRHEQAAAFAADGYARVSGRPGVCIATSGPGATNLVTGIANAFLDSVPMVAITGQVATPLMGTDAFQEVDIFGITLPIVKHSYIVRHIEELPRIVHEAWDIAASGRPGPVLIDLPKNIAAGEAHGARRVHEPRPTPARAEEVLLDRAAAMIAAAERPVIYAGGGIGIGRAVQAFRDFVAQTGIPVVSTLKGLGAIATDDPEFLGMLGMHGSRAANSAVQQSDLLVVVGARFDDRATGKLDGFAPGARVVHLDIDPAEIDKLRRADLALAGDLSSSLAALAQQRPRIGAWRRHCQRLKAEHAHRYDAPGDGIYVPELLRRLSVASEGEAAFTCDVGQHQMWVAQHCLIRRPERHLTSGGLGAMGYGLPAAIGAQLADPARTTIAVSGDGSIMINIQELATLKRYGLPVKILLIDNQSLGMVRQWQELFFERRFSEVDLSDNPDFAKVARSFGIDALTIDEKGQVDEAIDALLNHTGPLFVHCRIDPAANVWPLVPPGHTNATMLEGSTQ